MSKILGKKAHGAARKMTKDKLRLMTKAIFEYHLERTKKERGIK